MNQITPEELFAIIGELFVENMMLKKHIQTDVKKGKKEEKDERPSNNSI